MNMALTIGEPAGVGPDVIAMWLCENSTVSKDVVVFGCADTLYARAKMLGLTLPNTLVVENIPTAKRVVAGKLNKHNANCVLTMLESAAKSVLAGELQSLVTGPIHKGIINDAGVSFSGHTEFFQNLCKVPKVVMCLATKGLRVCLATTHLPLQAVSAAITRDELEKTVLVIQQALQTKFGIAAPKIAVLGLNPHAGEGGHLGREEIETIGPVIEALNKQGLDLVGPLSADTVFSPENLNQFDVFLGMYHDQVLPVLKYKGFHNSANITLGLPFVRTSVDHGTALSLAGSGKASAQSFCYAVSQARAMTQSHYNQG